MNFIYPRIIDIKSSSFEAQQPPLLWDMLRAYIAVQQWKRARESNLYSNLYSAFVTT